MLPLRRLLLRDLLVLVGAAAALITFPLWWGQRASLREQAEARTSLLVDHLRSDLNASMAQVEGLGGTLQSLWSENTLALPATEAGESQLHALVRQHPLVASVFFVDERGEGIFLSRANLEDSPSQRTLNSFQLHQDAGTSWMTTLRRNGRPLAPRERPPREVYLDPTTRPWFVAARQSPVSLWVEPYPFYGTSLTGITYVVPLRGPGGTFKGVMGLDLMLEDLTGRFWKAHPTSGSLMALVDGQGRTILPPLSPEMKDPLHRSQAFLQPLDATAYPVLAHLWRRTGEVNWMDLGQGSRLGLRRALREAGTPAWTLLVAVPERELLGGAQRRLLFALGACVLVMLLVGWHSLRLARRFGNPLRDLSRAAKRLGQGQVPAIPDTPIAEIHTLGEALHQAGEAQQDRARLQQQLQHSQRLETLGTLAGGIAHDVNNQLGAILGQLFLAREVLPAGSPGAQRLIRAEEAVERCAQTTKALLAFSHNAQADLRPLAFNHLIQRTAGLLDRILGGLVRVELDLDPNLPDILGEPLQLEQVIMNIAVNARDAMPEGGRLTFRTRPSGPGHVTLTITDTGKGIPPDVLPHIFEPFFTTKPVGKGTGLGLAMAFGILRAHGGTLDVESAPGRGSSFTLRLPASGTLHAEEQGAKAEADMGPLAGLRILVAEDEVDLRETLADALTIARAQVETAPDGDVAWQLFRSTSYDLVLSDQRMPMCTGMELLRRIRGMGSRIPFILASGQDLEPFRPELEGDAGTRLLPKPFSVARLMELVQEFGVPRKIS
ncbi:MAG TPA: ATP-binding protein [Holophagaceae bacterium]|nr:ATP-binding protein [Holophagaceae bacterium]